MSEDREAAEIAAAGEDRAAVILSVREGPSAQRAFHFTERTTCVLGRASDCRPRLPEDDRRVSRHHCLFDINPPDVRIRDFGSLNGTFVNGEEIGRRRPDQKPGQAARTEFPERDLAHGDEVRIGRTLLRVETVTGATTLEPTRMYCAHCGRDTSESADRGRPGDVVCGACRRDPRALVRSLLAGPGRMNRYELVRELGRGGQGVVHLARHLDTGEFVALKVLLAEVAVGHRARNAFLREIESVRGLRHPGIVGYRDSGAQGATFYLAGEYCAYGTLAELLTERRTLPPAEAVALAAQVLDGLDHAHTRHGLVHRDVKPSNILFAARPGSASGTPGAVKISDFGLAKAFDQAGLSGLTRTGAVAGTVAYMPRTQVVDYKYARPEVDVWATAATLYRMLTGTTPRTFPPDADPIMVLLRDAAVPIRDRVPSIPRRLADVIDEALIDSPRIRTTTAESFRRALHAAL